MKDNLAVRILGGQKPASFVVCLFGLSVLFAIFTFKTANGDLSLIYSILAVVLILVNGIYCTAKLVSYWMKKKNGTNP